MAFKIVVLVAAIAYANAGFIGAPAVATYSAAPAVSTSYIHQAAPVAVAHAAPVLSTYAASPVAIHAPSVGASHQSVERSLGGAQSVSHYSKAVDSAFSSVRKYDTRITNDALSLAHAPVVSAYAAPYVTKSVAPVVSTYATHGPIVSSYSAPVATYSHSAPVVSAYSPVVAKTAVAYSPAAVVSHATFTGLGTAYQW